MPNRVVPSVGLPGWAGVAEGRAPYQQVVLAVDGEKVASAEDLYRRVARQPAGREVVYLFGRASGVHIQAFPARRLSDGEFTAIFGAYLLTGLAYLLLAVLAAIRWREGALYQGLAAFGWTGAAFSFTGMDLYGPGAMFRLHVFAEAMLPAATAHLALVCPRNRVARRPGLLPLVYGGSLALAFLYEAFLFQPGAYTPIHNIAQALAGVPLIAFTVNLALTMSERPAGARPKDTPLLLGATLAGALLPAFILGISGATGGNLPVNIAAWTGWIFPLGCCVAYRLVPCLPETDAALAEAAS